MRKTVVGVAILLLLTQSAWATRMPVHEAAESPDYGRKFGGMIGRGVINVATSFVDLLVNVVNETRNGPPVVGTLVGLGKGAGCTTLRALSGGVDLVTFWVPGFNGFPVSDSYENCLAPAAAVPGAVSSPVYPSVEPPSSAPTPGPAVTPPPTAEKPPYTK